MTKSGILHQLKGKVVDLVTVPVADGTARRGKPSAETTAVPLDRDQFAQEFNHRFTRQDVVVAGKVHILDLQAIHERIRKQSLRVADSIDVIVQQAIERHLTEADFYSPFKDNYLIAFGELSKEEAQLKCGLIAEEISRWLFGKEPPDNAVVKTVVARVYRDTDPKALQGIEAVSLALEHAEVSAELEAEYYRTSKTSGLSNLPRNLQFFYRPMWHVRRKVVSTFVCTAAWSRSSGRLLVGEQVLRDPSDPAAIAELDLKTLCKVIDDLDEAKKLEQRRVVALRVHYSTLNDRNTLQDYLEIWRQVPQDFRRIIVVELVGLPKGVLNSRMLEISLYLKPMTRARIACLSLDDPDFSAVSDIGLFAVGTNLRNHAGTELEIIEQVERFSEKANKKGFRTYIHGLHTLSLTTAAICAGFDYIDGDGITSLVDAPKQMYPLDAQNLYHRLASSVPEPVGE